MKDWVMDYLKWLLKQRVWMLIIGSQALVVALSTNHRIQYALILFWAMVTSMYNHLSDLNRGLADVWRGLYYDEKEYSDKVEAEALKLANQLLQKQKRNLS